MMVGYLQTRDAGKDDRLHLEELRMDKMDCKLDQDNGMRVGELHTRY